MREQCCRFSASSLVVVSVLLCQFFVSTHSARAQVPLPSGGRQTGLRMNDIKDNHCEQLRSLEVIVVNENKARLDRQAVVKLHDQKRDIVSYDTTSQESDLTFCDVDYGDYDVEVSAVGYLAEHKEAQVTGAIMNVKLEVMLRKDPTAVDLSYDAIPAAARKEARRAVYALKSGKYKDAQKRLDKIHEFTASSAQLNFLFGYLFLQLSDLETSETYLSHAAALDPGKVQTLTFLGRVQLQRQHYDDAQKTLEGAVSVGPAYWMAHDFLADAYLRQKKYEKALEQAQRAIDEGKSGAKVAQLVLGQALANLGRDQEGVQALKTFVQSDPGNPAIPQVEALIGKIEARDSSGAAGAEETHTDLALVASPPSLPASAWGPPAVDDVKPSVAANVSCPYQQVVDGSGERVKQLVDNITRFAAIEDLVHEQLDQTGSPITKETRKFDYVASISETRPGFLATEEFRNLRYGIADLPDHIVTMGFMSLALIFHPDMRDDFQMSCEGLGDWRGKLPGSCTFGSARTTPTALPNTRSAVQIIR